MLLPASGEALPSRLAAVDSERWSVLLVESLSLWQVEGQVLPGDATRPGFLLAVVVAADGERLSIAAAEREEEPVRWWLQWHAPAPADQPLPAVARRKPCASTLGLLRTLREALGAQGGRRARIAAGLS